ncbi:hypothetical protein FACS189437_06370 [Bacteroidia bacterium]|nr:hypothetical protein FACS189437_06370 [Bacteroidia bacterium]
MKTVKLTLCFIFLFSYASLFARDSTKEQKIEDSLKSINPVLVPLFQEATTAMDDGDLPLADSLYSIVYQQASAFDPVIRRLGMIRFQSGKEEEGIELCELALTINRSAYNLVSLATCYAGEGNHQNLMEASSLLKKAQMLPDGDDADILIFFGQIALQKEDIADFRSATNDLLEKYPDLMVTHYFAAILAAQEEEWERAEKEILQAQELGLPEEAVNSFLNLGVGSHVKKQHWLYSSLWLIGIWAFGLFVLFVVGKILSNMTLRSIEKQTLTSESNNSAKKLRPLYRFFMNVGGVYYYLSLPIIIVLVIALVVALFYLFFFIGRIPIKLMLILVIGSVVTIFGMIKSLLVKVDYSDPGRKLEKEEAPQLYKLTEEVASTIGTRSIDEIRITPATDLAVYERGSRKDKFQDKAERILILGIGVLKEFNQSDFCAVLAHEYGHFSHRDTAGGDVALRVRTDINKYFYALYATGQNVWWNVAFHFLRLYNFIFRRISHGSTRLQEVLADNLAARTYGKEAFQNGLTYVIKRDIEFNTFAVQEVEEAKKANRPFNNLYELSGNSTGTIEEELQKALNRPTSEDDTHPSPTDRFRFIANADSYNTYYNTSKIKDLFRNWDSITQEMTQEIENQYKEDVH